MKTRKKSVKKSRKKSVRKSRKTRMGMRTAKNAILEDPYFIKGALAPFVIQPKKLREWIDKKGINLKMLCNNPDPGAMEIVCQNLDSKEIDWFNLSRNSGIRDIFFNEKEEKRWSLRGLCQNPNREILEYIKKYFFQNTDKINSRHIYNLSFNKNPIAIDIIRHFKKMDSKSQLFDNSDVWINLASNPYAIDLINEVRYNQEVYDKIFNEYYKKDKFNNEVLKNPEYDGWSRFDFKDTFQKLGILNKLEYISVNNSDNAVNFLIKLYNIIEDKNGKVKILSAIAENPNETTLKFIEPIILEGLKEEDEIIENIVKYQFSRNNSDKSFDFRASIWNSYLDNDKNPYYLFDAKFLAKYNKNPKTNIILRAMHEFFEEIGVRRGENRGEEFLRSIFKYLLNRPDSIDLVETGIVKYGFILSDDDWESLSKNPSIFINDNSSKGLREAKCMQKYFAKTLISKKKDE